MIKKETLLKKKVSLSIDSNSKVPLFIHSTISNHENVSSKKPTYFSLSFFINRERIHQLSYYLMNGEITFKEGFNMLL